MLDRDSAMRIRPKLTGSARVVAWAYTIFGALVLVTSLFRVGADTGYPPEIIIAGGFLTGAPFLVAGAGILGRARWAWWLAVVFTLLLVGSLLIAAVTAQESFGAVIGAIFGLALAGLVVGSSETASAEAGQDCSDQELGDSRGSLPTPPAPAVYHDGPVTLEASPSEITPASIAKTPPQLETAAARKDRRPVLVIVSALVGMLLMGAAFGAGFLIRAADPDSPSPSPLSAQDARAISAMSAALARWNASAATVVRDYQTGGFDSTVWYGSPFHEMGVRFTDMRSEAGRIHDPEVAKLAERLITAVGKELTALYHLRFAVFSASSCLDPQANPYCLDLPREGPPSPAERKALRELRRAAKQRARLAEDFLRYMEGDSG